MSTRAALVGRLLAVPTAELLELLDDDAIIDLAARYFQRLAETPTEDVGSLAAIETAADIASSDVTAVQSAADAVSSDPFKDKARRPLNGFMAFRSKNQLRLVTGKPG